MSSNWGGYNPFGTLSQQASMWIPALLQMQQQKRQQALQAFEMFRQMYPNQAPSQAMMAGVEQAVPGLQLPRQTQFSGRADETAGPAVPPTSTGEGPFAQPETQAPAPQVTRTEQIVPPEQPVGRRTVAEILQGNPFLDRIPDRIKNMPWDDARQIYPDIGKYAEQSLIPQTDISGISGVNISRADLRKNLAQAVQSGQITTSQAARIWSDHERAAQGQLREKATQWALEETTNAPKRTVDMRELGRQMIELGMTPASELGQARQKATIEARKELRDQAHLDLAYASFGLHRQTIAMAAQRLGMAEQELGLRIIQAKERIPPAAQEAIKRWQQVLDNASPGSAQAKAAETNLQSLYKQYQIPLEPTSIHKSSAVTKLQETAAGLQGQLQYWQAALTSATQKNDTGMKATAQSQIDAVQAKLAGVQAEIGQASVIPPEPHTSAWMSELAGYVNQSRDMKIKDPAHAPQWYQVERWLQEQGANETEIARMKTLFEAKQTVGAAP